MKKFLYLNIKNKNSIFSIGFVHEAIWGGEINRKIKNSKNSSINFKFFKVFISADGPNDFQPHANALVIIWEFGIFQLKKNLRK